MSLPERIPGNSYCSRDVEPAGQILAKQATSCRSSRNWGLRLVVSPLLLALIPIIAAAQSEGNNEGLIQPNFSVGVVMIPVGVLVTDREGRPVFGLERKDFLLYEDDVRQDISFFSEHGQPISLGLLLDKSHSMEGQKFDCVKRAALAFLSNAPPNSDFLFITFDHDVQIVCPFTSAANHVKPLLAETEKSEGGTSLYDALAATLEHFTNARHPRQALVVITDGADQHSRTPLERVLHRLQSSMVQLHLVGYFNPFESRIFDESGLMVELIDGSWIDNPKIVFDRLSEDSGARAWFPKSDHELQMAARQILADLRSQYTLAYHPPDRPGKGEYRRIKVRVRRKGVYVKARHGYRLRE